MPIQRLLVANRGEIAIRILRAAAGNARPRFAGDGILAVDPFVGRRIDEAPVDVQSVAGQSFGLRRGGKVGLVGGERCGLRVHGRLRQLVLSYYH